MKRMICVALALLLMLAGLPALAMDADGYLEASGEQGFLYGFVAGNRVMLADRDALYEWRPGEAEASRYDYVLPELGENELATVYPFCAGDKLYAIRLVEEFDEDGGDDVDYRHTALYELTLSDSVAEGEMLDRLDWDDLVKYNGDQTTALFPVQIVDDGTRVWLICDSQGGDSITTVARLDIEDVSLEVDDGLENIVAMLPYKEDKLLMLQQGRYSKESVLLRYDPEEEETETLCAFTHHEYSPLRGLAWDQEKDALYITKDGEVCPLDLTAGQIGSGIAAMPNTVEMSFNNALVMNGVYVLCNTSVVSRALYDRPEVTTRLTVNAPEIWDELSGVVNRFNQSHDAVRVLLNTDSGAQDQIVESMMRQDNSIDIYILDTSKPSYEAVFHRGFLLPLNDSAAITAVTGQMYPGIQRSITRQGKLQVLPMQAGAYILGVNEKTLKKLGLTRADIPDNWDAFLDFLPTLEGPLSDNPNVKLMDGASSINQLRLILLGLIFNGYDYYNTANDIDAPFNAEPMRGLTEKLAAIDFEPLGLEWDEEASVEDLMTFSYELEPTALFNFSTGCTPCSFGWLDYQPLLLDMTADRPTCLLIDCRMAAVNPYTRYPKQALEFMETLAENLSPGLRATLIPGWNEPVRGDTNAHMIEEQREIVAQLEDQLAAASDANRRLAQSDLDYAREALEELEQNAWEVSPRALEWYHAHDQYVMPTGVNWLDSDLGKGNQENLMQFCAGKLSGEDLLAAFDKSTDMMRREGN